MAETDEALIKRTSEGNLDALGELFDRHQPRLCAFLHRLIGEEATAEDLAQETFWRVWRHRASYDPRREFAPWVYGIARHRAKNHPTFGTFLTASREPLQRGGENARAVRDTD